MCLHPQSLYTIERGADKAEYKSYPDYLDLRDRNRSFDDLVAYSIVCGGTGYGQESIRRLGL